MERSVNYTFVGLFAVLLCIGFAASIIWLGRFGEKDDFDYYRVYVAESVSGLNVEAPVKYRGVVVGSVQDVEISEKNSEEVELTLKVKKHTPIRTSSAASLKPQGITGLSFVDIVPGDKNAPLLVSSSRSEPAVIRYLPSFLSKVDESITGLTTSIQSIANKTDAAMSQENMKNISHILVNLNSATEKLSRNLDTLQSIALESRTLPADFAKTSQKLSITADTVAKMAQSIQASVERGDYAYKAELAPTLQKSETLLRNLDELSQRSEGLVSDIQKNPSSLLFNSTTVPRGPGE